MCRGCSAKLDVSNRVEIAILVHDAAQV